MSATLTLVSEDFTNHNQSWYYTAVFRSSGATLRAEVRKNAYREQSYAKLESWGMGGWNFFDSLPTEDWFENTPSYTRMTIDEAGVKRFREIVQELLERYCHAMWNVTDGVAVRQSERHSDYEYGRMIWTLVDAPDEFVVN